MVVNGLATMGVVVGAKREMYNNYLMFALAHTFRCDDSTFRGSQRASKTIANDMTNHFLLVNDLYMRRHALGYALMCVVKMRAKPPNFFMTLL